MTGELGQELNVSSGSVSVDLNGIESISLVVSRDSLSGVPRAWWSPWAGCVVVTYTSPWLTETIIAAGPLTDPPVEDRAAATVSLTAKGFGALLEKRIALAGDFTPGDEDALKRSVLAFQDVDLGTIAGGIVTAATSKSAGWAPVVVPPGRAGTRMRTYEGWNLANNNAWKRIRELTEVINGPDVMFRPRWEDESRTRFEWVLCTGTESQPAIGQDRPVVWDATSRDSPVASMSVSSSAELMASRAYCTGAGEGAGVAVAIAEAPAVPDKMPLLETVLSDTDAENVPLLLEKARAALVSQPIEQVSLTVHSQADAPFGTWQVGDEVEVVSEGWLSVPDGSHNLRLISAKYTFGSDIASVECQQETLGRELSW